MSGPYKSYAGYSIHAGPPLQDATVQGVVGQKAAAENAQAPASSVLELYQASYALSGLLIRDVTGKKAREIAAHELALRLIDGLEGKIQTAMKAHPSNGFNIDAVRYEVQFLIHTREEFKQAVRAEATKLLENALS